MEGINLKTANSSDKVALRGVRIASVLAGMSQKTIVEQSFFNSEKHAIEAVYTFPLPDGAAVCAFEVLTSDRVLTGMIDETDKAIEKYESAIATGDAAFLAEQDRPDVFSIRVGNIKPRQSATIRLTYVCLLDVNDDQIRVAFPTTVAPRFTTGTGMDPLDAAIDGEALNPPCWLNVPYGLTLSVEVKLGRKIKSIASPSHAVNVTGDDREGYSVALNGTAAMDHEVILQIDLAKEVGACVQVEKAAGNESFLAVTFVPEFEAEPQIPVASETVFLLDCSGSMQGTSMMQAMAALELCLRTLNEGDTFNICKFGSTFAMMNPTPIVYSQETLDRAIAYLSHGNSLGGTELFAPLEVVLRTHPQTGAIRNVIVLTDGQVTNEPAVLAMARRHRGRNRIFSFGIGAASSSFLVKGLARVTGGAAEFISKNERIDEKVLRTFARLASPPATDIRIDWGGAEVQTLADLPPVFDGDVLTVFGRVMGSLPREISLQCKTPAGERSWRVAVPAVAMKGTAIGTLWARRSIQSLEEVNGVSRSASLNKGSREHDLVIQLSKEFGLLSTLTTYVAVEHRSVEERNSGQPALRRVPVMLADGWGDEDSLGAVLMDSTMKRRFNPRSKSTGSYADTIALDRAPRIHMAFNPEGVAHASAPRVSPPAPAAAAGGVAPLAELASESANRFDDANGVSVVLMMQSASGFFRWDEKIDRIAPEVPGGAAFIQKIDALVPIQITERLVVLSTLRALIVLQVKFASDEPIWKRAAEKALRYLSNAMGKPATEIRIWLDQCKAAVMAPS